MTSFTIYGLRLRGDREVRYVGQTNQNPEKRLRGHRMAATARRYGSISDRLADWLVDNDGEVEVFAIAKVDTREDALAYERTIIGLCLRLEMRLFNQRQIPVDLRVVA